MGSQSEAEKEFSTARELIEELANTVPNGEARGNISQRAHDRLRLQASVSDPDELRILLGRRETEPRASNGL
jgi:hypothetical protein